MARAAGFSLSSGAICYSLEPVSDATSSTDRLATRIMWGMLVGLVLGCAARAAAHFAPSFEAPMIWMADKVFQPFGQIFLRLLFIVVVPLVFGSLALGVVQLGSLSKLGPLAGRTFALFGVNMSIAVAMGLTMMTLLNPGGHIDPEVKDQMLAEFGSSAQEIKGKAEARGSVDLMFMVNMFLPANILKSVVEFQVLPLIVFALLLGAAGTSLSEGHRARMQTGLEILNELMVRIVHFALLLAPYAVPAMIFGVVVKFGLSILVSLGVFVAGVLFVMSLHLFVVMSLLLKLLSRRTPKQFFSAVRTVMITAFSTSSSSATLPTSIQVAKEKLGVSSTTAGFVLPLGATLNMSGTALYEGCVVLFIAQAYGVELGLLQSLTLLLLSVLSAVAVAGIPGGSLPLIVGLLSTFGVPGEGIILILGTDRILDMARTTLNVSADLVTACIVDDQLAAKVQASS
jgi:Na+/H+-dicarboxylate symporter